MRLPSISPDNKTREFIDVFGGYNHNPRINDNEFYDMKNLSSDSYPLLSTRARRGSIPLSAMSPSVYPTGGIFFCERLYYITIADHSAHDYQIVLRKVEESGSQYVQRDVATWISTDNGIRKIISMGAKLIIMPDKIVVNTASLGNDAEQNAVKIENETAAAGTVTIQPCLEDGTVLTVDYVGDDSPDTPPDGYVWLDTKYSPASLKKYYAASGMWQSFISSFIKISDTGVSAENISVGFTEGDGIKVSGITIDGLDDLNAVSILRGAPDNKSLVLSRELSLGNMPALEVMAPVRNQTTVNFYSNSPVTQNQFAGMQIQVADRTPATCASNTASSWTYKPGGEDLAQGSSTLKFDESKGAQSGSKIYVDLTGTQGFSENIIGRKAQIGDGENHVDIISTGSEPGGYAYIVVSTELSSFPSNTIIYPVVQMRKTTLTFSANVIVSKGEKAVPTLATMYTQNCAQNPIAFSRKMPLMDFVIESQNRLWGCRYGSENEDGTGKFLNEIYCSKMGDEKNWEVYQGISTDSYRASVGSEGNWTGAANYRGYPVFFKENHIHSVLGNYPPYQISDTVARGVQKGSSASLAMINEVLYYKSIHGICAYSGGLPADISSALGDVPYKDAIACAFKGKYYICMKDIANNQVMFVFDTVRGLWHKEDDFYPAQFAVANDDVYFLMENETGSLLGTGGADSAPVEWYAETGLYGVQMIDSKYISRINMRVKIPVGNYMFISIMYDSSGRWEQLGNVIGHSLTPFTLPIKPRRCDHFRLRLEGRGEMRLYSISKTIEQGSDRC